MKIFKYPLTLDQWSKVAIPMGGEVLSCQEQNGAPYLWVLVNESAPVQVRKFHIYGTGHNIDNDIPMVFISTVQVGPFVWHVFEETL